MFNKLLISSKQITFKAAVLFASLYLTIAPSHAADCPVGLQNEAFIGNSANDKDTLLICPPMNGRLQVGGVHGTDDLMGTISAMGSLIVKQDSLISSLQATLSSLSETSKSQERDICPLTTAMSVKMQVATNGAVDWQYFSTSDSAHYLIVANHHNGQTYNINSTLYRFNMATERLEVLQQVATIGAVDWEHFSTSDSAHYLIVANQRNDQTHNINSTLYRVRLQCLL